MPLDFYFVNASLLLILVLVCGRRWAFVCVLGLFELCWACLIFMYAVVAVSCLDLFLLF